MKPRTPLNLQPAAPLDHQVARRVIEREVVENQREAQRRQRYFYDRNSQFKIPGGRLCPDQKPQFTPKSKPQTTAKIHRTSNYHKPSKTIPRPRPHLCRGTELQSTNPSSPCPYLRYETILLSNRRTRIQCTSGCRRARQQERAKSRKSRTNSAGSAHTRTTARQ